MKHLSPMAAISAVLLLAGLFWSAPAEARRHPSPNYGTETQFCGDRYCQFKSTSPDSYFRRSRHGARVTYGDGSVVGHPSGCPSRAFCGCGASVEVFGRPVRELFLAANWFKFPPAQAAPGMVAVRRGHVFVIRQVLGDGMVLAYDANSGGHRTRVHPRSLAGYSVRNPRGGHA